MRRHGRMSDEGRFLAGIEEAQDEIVIRARWREHECRFGVREFPRDAAERGVALPIGIQNYGGRVAGEARPREGIDVKNAHGELSGSGTAAMDVSEFCMPLIIRLHSRGSRA
jgi:hypothetical protein